MGLNDLLNFFHQYGPAGVGFALLIFVVGILYKQNIDNYKERLNEANQRSERFEKEVKDLNDEIQKYLALGMRVQRTMGDATDEIRRMT
jgi:hypothetical protein